MVCKKCEKVRTLCHHCLGRKLWYRLAETLKSRGPRSICIHLFEHKRWLEEDRRKQVDRSSLSRRRLQFEESLPGARVPAFGSSSCVESYCQPYQSKCKDCKQPTTQNKAKYCHGALVLQANAFCNWKWSDRLRLQEGLMLNMREADPWYYWICYELEITSCTFTLTSSRQLARDSKRNLLYRYSYGDA